METKKNTAQDDKKKIAALAGVIVLFVGIAYVEWTRGGGSGGGSGPTITQTAVPLPAPPAKPERAAKNAPDDPLASYDPAIKVADLQAFQARPAPQFDRSPINFGLTQEQKKAQQDEQKRIEDQAKNPPPQPPPPPPPPITLRALGYEEAKGGARQAFITDCMDPNNCSSGEKEMDVYSVRRGESFANRYKVLDITPTAVEVEDESGHQKAQLPFPSD